MSPLLSKRLLLLAGDAAATAAAVATALFLRHSGLPDLPLLWLYAFATPFLLTLWLFGFLAFGLYDLRAAKNDTRFFERLARAIAANALVTFVLFQLIPEFRLTPRATMAIIAAAAAAFLFAWRAAYNALLARTARERLLFFGLSDEVLELGRHLRQNPQLGYEVVVGVPANSATTPPSQILPIRNLPPEGLGPMIRSHQIHTIVISGDIKTNTLFTSILFQAVPLGVAVTEFPRLYETVMGKIPTSLIGEVWFLENLAGSKRPRYEFAKRILDLTAAALIGMLSLALLPIIGTAIILATPRDILSYRKRRAHTGDGIIFFRQKRIGRHGLPFGFMKFRSQVLGAEKFGGEKEVSRDPRAYPVGTFLRRTYLDELPQVWNIIKGEMSFVGPRPERPKFARELAGGIPFYRMRELVLPGITGWAQINMENDASVSDAPEKLCYDLFYIKNRTLVLDFIILFRTALKILQRSGR